MNIYQRMRHREELMTGRHLVVDTRYDTGASVELVAALVEAATT